MFYFTDKELDDLLIEDVPYSDVTTSFLRIENKPGKIQVATRESTIVCCTEEIMKLFTKLGIKTTLFTPSGEQIDGNVKFLEGEGLTRSLHSVWRVTENLIGYASGIATRTRKLVDIVRNINPGIAVATTRKTAPLTRKIAAKAVKAGGATVHRLGLSESILVLDNHLKFLGGIDHLRKRIAEQRIIAGSRPVCVEAGSYEEALKIAGMDVEMIVLNKFKPVEIRKLKKQITGNKCGSKLAAAGGINADNIADYAKSGADMLITSWPYFGNPADLTITMQPVFDVY